LNWIVFCVDERIVVPQLRHIIHSAIPSAFCGPNERLRRQWAFFLGRGPRLPQEACIVFNPRPTRGVMKNIIRIFYCTLFAALVSQNAIAAPNPGKPNVKPLYNPCPNGRVTTYCECYMGATGNYQPCPPGHYCDTNGGVCTSARELNLKKSLKPKHS
jgi:hypothetical protein